MVWNIDPVLLRMGPLEIRYYGLCFVAALLGGFYWWRWRLLLGGRTEETAERLLLPAALAVVVGARLAHVIFYEPGRFFADPITILYVWQGGLASHGATVTLMLTLYWFSVKEKMPLLEVFDRFSFAAAWGAALVRIGNFFNSEIVGRPTGVPWGIKFPRFDVAMSIDHVPVRHPSQIYEFLLASAVLALLCFLDRKDGEGKRGRGFFGGVFLTAYFGGRFFVEYAKAYEGIPDTFPLTMGQMLSVPFALAGVWLIISSKKNLPAPAVKTAGARAVKRKA